MRRIVPLLAVTAGTLLLIGCDDGAAAPRGSATVAVGTLADRAPATEPSVAPTDEVDDSEPSTTTDATRAPTTTAPPTRLGDALADLFDGKTDEAPPTDVVVDDTQRLRLEVPEVWSDRRTSPSPLTAGAAAPALAAAADQTKFLDGYGAAGLTAVVVDAAPSAALDAYAFADCEGGGRKRFRTDRLTGVYEVWRDCRETATSIVTVAVRPARSDETVLLLAQVLTPSDLAALDHALATLRLSPP